MWINDITSSFQFDCVSTSKWIFLFQSALIFMLIPRKCSIEFLNRRISATNMFAASNLYLCYHVFNNLVFLIYDSCRSTSKHGFCVCIERAFVLFCVELNGGGMCVIVFVGMWSSVKFNTQHGSSRCISNIIDVWFHDVIRMSMLLLLFVIDERGCSTIGG